MKAPTTYEEAVAIAEKYSIDPQSLLSAYGIDDPNMAELKAKLDAATDFDVMWKVFNKTPAGSPIEAEAIRKIVELTE